MVYNTIYNHNCVERMNSMKLYVICRRGPKEFWAGMLKGVLTEYQPGKSIVLVSTRFNIESLSWVPYKKIAGVKDIKSLKKFMTPRRFLHVKLGKNTLGATRSLYTEDINDFIKFLLEVSKSKQIWINNLSTVLPSPGEAKSSEVRNVLRAKKVTTGIL